MFNRKPQGKASSKDADNVEVEETLSPLERGRHFGTSKLSLQRLVCVHELVDGAHEIGYDLTVHHLLPLVKKLAVDSEVLVRHTLLGHFGDLAGFLIQSNPAEGPEGGGYQKVVDDLLPIIAELLATEKNSEVRQSAADALCTLASHLRPGERGDQVLMTVIQLSHSNDDEDARSTAVQLLNSLAETLGRDLCQQFVSIELIALCEDPAFRVRKATASNFAEVARVVDDKVVLERLLPAFGKLVRDQHWGVRKAAAESLVGLAMALKVELREEPLVPLMNALLGDYSRWVRMSGLQQLGYFIAALESPQRVPPDLLTEYVEIIEQTKANPDAADISYHCAFTFAAVTRTMGKECWNKLQAPFASLCKDTQLKTRKAMAASVHIVAQTLGSECTEQEVLPHFEALLQDTADEVRFAALKNVSAILKVVTKLSPQKRLLNTLQGSISAADNNWRLRHLVGSQIGRICEALSDCSSGIGDEACLQGQELTTTLLFPLLMKLCEDGVAEVRDEAARSTAKTLRAAAPELFADPATTGPEGSSGESPCSNSLSALLPQTKALVKKLHSLARGKTHRHRLTYIHMCDSVIRDAQTDRPSPRPHAVFTDYLLKPLARLASDPVKNVRLCWATMLLPHLRRMGRLGQTPRYSYVLIAIVRKMAQEDSDAEVRRVLAGAQIVELPEGVNVDLSLESDHDDSDKEQSRMAGGTGDSSDGGVAEEEEKDSKAPVQPLEADHSGAVGSTSPVASSSTESDAPAAGDASSSSPTSSDDAAKALKLPAAASSTSPKIVPIVPKQNSPKSQTIFDPVEDGLVHQKDIEKDMDATFADRRLFHEAESDVQFSSHHADRVRESPSARLVDVIDIDDISSSSSAPPAAPSAAAYPAASSAPVAVAAAAEELVADVAPAADESSAPPADIIKADSAVDAPAEASAAAPVEEQAAAVEPPAEAAAADSAESATTSSEEATPVAAEVQEVVSPEPAAEETAAAPAASEAAPATKDAVPEQEEF